MRLSWHDLGTQRAEGAHGKTAEITGWPVTLLRLKSADYFLLTPGPNCCAGCLPRHPLTTIEVFANEDVAFSGGSLQLSGTLQVVTDDPEGWRYQLKDARRIGITRRTLLAAAPIAAMPLPLAAEPVSGLTVDLHSHAGNVIHVNSQNGNEPFLPVAEPMRQGGMSVVCLAIVADSGTTNVSEGRIRPYRNPNPGELYEHSKKAFARLHRLVREQGLGIVLTASDLAAARSERPSIVVSSEGGDFLEGRPDRVDEAYEKWQLRHLQLTHYRPNELGDIQTEPAVNGGLTDAGAAVIRRCNKIGIVVDVAHGTYDLVKKAAAVTTKPLILSHTSLTQRPSPWTRLITPDHAKAVAATGGVIGIWPIKEIFGTYRSYADGFARMVDQVGVDHVGLGTDLLGLLDASTIPNYDELPQLAAALRARFNESETAQLLGGNYQRVFAASFG
jgi:membrane dipeptidase